MIDEDAHQTSHVDGSYRRLALKRARLTVHIVLLTVAIAVGWSAFAQIDQITRGDGRVIPLRRMQSIESLEGGILSDLLVSEGDLVKEGQIIANLDATRSRAAFLSAQSEVESLKAEVERLEAEVLEKPALDFGGNPTATEQTELRLFNARRTRLEASLKALEGERSSVQQQLDITGPLASSGSVSRIDVLQLQQKLAELEGKISEARNG